MLNTIKILNHTRRSQVILSLCIFSAMVFSTVVDIQAAGKPGSPWNAPRSAVTKKNPVAANKASIKKGKALYSVNCVACHGNSGKGNGPAAVALPIRPGNFKDNARMEGQSDGSLFWKISIGRGTMPAFKGAMSDSDRWNLVNYLRALSE